MLVPSSSACFSSTSDTFASSSEPCCTCMNTAPANPRPVASRGPAESLQVRGAEALVRARPSEDGANAEAGEAARSAAALHRNAEKMVALMVSRVQ